MNDESKLFVSSLFLSGTPLNVKFFRKMMEPINLENRLVEYQKEFNSLNTGLFIRQVAEGFQMVTDKDVFDELKKFFGEKTETLSRAALETLSVIAYKQPVTKIEIEELRGVNSSGTVKLLLDRNLIKVIGRKDVPGRPLLYSTTKKFYEYFGLKSLSDLPTFREWQEMQQK
jgi:segregation and condensation protein B